MTRKSAQQGFTIIELVVVIILLGILAATALPRFLDVNTEAHAAVVDGVSGSLQTGMSLYRAQWIAEGQPDPDTQIAEFNNLRVNAAGFPYGTDDNSGTTSDVVDSDDCVAVFNGMLQAGAPSVTGVAALANVTGSASDFTTVGAAGSCVYYYTGDSSVAGTTVETLTYTSGTGVIAEGTVALP